MLPDTKKLSTISVMYTRFERYEFSKIVEQTNFNFKWMFNWDLLLTWITKTENFDADLILCHYKLDLMSLFMEIKSINQNLINNI